MGRNDGKPSKEAQRQEALAKAAKAGERASRAPKAPKQRWYKTLAVAYTNTRKHDTYLPLILAGAFAIPLALFVALGALIGPMWFWVVIGVPFALLAAVFLFGRRVEKAMYAQVEGQPGAAASVLGTLRSGWFTTPAVAVTKNQDVIHRVLGRPGVILVAEGPPSRTSNLMATEVKRHRRFVGETPIHEVFVGDGEGQVPLPKLTKHVTKLTRVLRPAEVTDLRKRVDAMAAMQQPLPIPKGPLPKSARMPKMPR